MADVDFHPAAFREYAAAAEWYRERNPDAARRFVAEIESIRSRIASRPDWYAWYDDDFREAVLLHFPFSVVFRTDTHGVSLIVAVAHASREPGYWEARN